MLLIWYLEKTPYSCPVLSHPDTLSSDHRLRQAAKLETFMCFSTAASLRSWEHLLFPIHGFVSSVWVTLFFGIWSKQHPSPSSRASPILWL